MNPLKASRADGRGLFVQSNQANFNFKCRRQACFSSPPLCSYDGLTTVELVRFPGKDSTNAGLSSLLINRPPVLKSSTCCFKSRVKLHRVQNTFHFSVSSEELLLFTFPHVFNKKCREKSIQTVCRKEHTDL